MSYRFQRNKIPSVAIVLSTEAAPKARVFFKRTGVKSASTKTIQPPNPLIKALSVYHICTKRQPQTQLGTIRVWRIPAIFSTLMFMRLTAKSTVQYSSYTSMNSAK
jgi:hypothetical protein